MKTLIQLCLVALGSLTLAACQTTTGGGRLDTDELRELAVEMDRLEVGIGAPARNIPEFRIDGWRYVNDKYLVISDGDNAHFLLTFIEPCEETSSALSIGFDKAGTLLNAGDYVVLRSLIRTLGRCRIDEINTLEPREGEEG